MDIADLIRPACIFIGLEASDKSELLSLLAERAAKFIGSDVEAILQALTKRESFGSTGIGRGIAIPHTAVKGLKTSAGFLARLKHAIDFESVDGQPVDLLLLLLTPPAPANENVAALAAVSRRLRDAGVLKALRESKNEQDAYTALTGRARDEAD